ncbi:MAG: PD-(D/E)XK nuclease family protein [Marinifilaceae bacterium]|jgi:hypothetical protein|nr:PD-(D/E)XK nuclease family protein [Marinifilaceae bacterium]
MNELKKILGKASIDLKTDEKFAYSLIFPFYSKVREKELSHSEVLSTFLNPYENHEHKNQFLRIFFEEIGLKKDFDSLTEVEIYTEYGTKVKDNSNSRPIDIFISYKIGSKKHGIIIENKLNNAVDQLNQINDYYDGIIKAGYICSKIVYMHINPSKKVNSTDTREDVLNFCYNYDITKLISSLASLEHYSYVKEYIKLLEKISYSFMNTINSTEIQNKLSQEEILKLIKVSNLINSDSWHEAKHNRILEKLSLNDLKHSFKRNYSQFYLKDYKFWIEVWYSSMGYKIWLCSYNDKLEEVQCKKWGKEKGYFYFELENNIFEFPSDENKMITEIKKLIKISGN